MGCVHRIWKNLSAIRRFYRLDRRLWSASVTTKGLTPSSSDHYGSQTGAADPLVQKERMLLDFLPLKWVLAGSGISSIRESCWLLITSLGEMFPDSKTLAEVALVIPVSSVAAESGFSLQNNIKTAIRSRLSEEKVQNLMTIASAAVPLETYDYVQAGTRFESMRTRRRVWDCV